MTTRLDPERWQRIGHVLDAALASEPEHWPAVLDATCAGAPDVRAEVEQLLARLDDARGFLESPPAAAAAAVLAERTASDGMTPGGRVGPYRIVTEIGEGGMSRVFLAERADGEFEQRVALKLLRPGLDTEIDRARFRAERQILASLNHPNIARLLDGGLTDAGHPYLALEYVEGQPIDVYCEEHGLTVQQRLELFLMAAEATQYAHRNLIVHRDIKASNIFVSVDGVVKLLDFGLAKLVEPAVYDAEPRTHTVAHWMTPEYAAPEQIRREPVTTLTDVYQLGVVLYRLMSGRLPFVAPHGDLRELETAVLRGDPPPPSSAVAQLDRGLARLLRGDVDGIVAMALRADPTERYASVEAFADDIRRHLSGHPVRARRISAAYRARRFVRRHKVETLAGFAIVISLLGGAGVAVWQARRAAMQRDLAQLASRESQAVTSFVVGVFEASDPSAARGDTLTAAELVRRAAARTELLRHQPLAQARMMEVTAQLYEGLGQYERAYDMLRRALDVRRATRGGRGDELAGTLVQYANVLIALGRHAQADSAANQALVLRQRALGPRDPAVAASLHQLATIAVYRGDFRAGEAYHRQALAIRQASLGPNDSTTAQSYLALCATLRREGRLADAEQNCRRGLAIVERALEPNDPQVAEAMLKLAYLLDEDRGNYAEAEPLYRRALEIRRQALGDGHPIVAATLLDIADLLARRGRFDEAVTTAEQGLRIARHALGPDHPAYISFSGREAVILYEAGRLNESAAMLRDAIASDLRIRGKDHENNAGLETNLARVLIAKREYRDAEPLLLDAIRIRQAVGGPSSTGGAFDEGMLGMLWSREGRYSAADSVLRGAVAKMERRVGREQPDLRELYGWLADLDESRGRHTEALQYRAIAKRN